MKRLGVFGLVAVAWWTACRPAGEDFDIRSHLVPGAITIVTFGAKW